MLPAEFRVPVLSCERRSCLRPRNYKGHQSDAYLLKLASRCRMAVAYAVYQLLESDLISVTRPMTSRRACGSCDFENESLG
jgi:hypothetical protein